MGSARDLVILVVEDEENLSYLTERQLTFLGYKVDQAPDGLNAIRKASNNRYDLILMDVMMPEMDGLEATQKIRADQTTPNSKTPIIAMTAFADKKRCLDGGMDDFVLKPVMLKPLKQILLKWLAAEVPEIDVVRDPPMLNDLSFKKTSNNLAAIDDRIKQLRREFRL